MLVLSSWLEHCRTACFVSLLFDGPLALPARPAPRFTISPIIHGPLVLSAGPAPRFPT
jgi:hypothetical protein